LSFFCKSCGDLVAEDNFSFQAVFIPAIGGRVCPDCHENIQHIINELNETGRFTMVDGDGNIMGIVLAIINRE
jgi:hypothetical protein